MNFILATALIGSLIQVGPNKPVRDLSKIADGNEYVLDYGSYVWPKNIAVKKSLTIRSADANARATVKFPSQWGQLPSGPDLGSPKGHSIVCYGNCVMKDLKTVGGEDVVIFNSQPGSTIVGQHIDMDGGGFIRGSGAKNISIINVQSSGRPTAYFIANFTNHVSEFLVDLSANTLPVQQGGKITKGNPAGEAAIRFMNVDHLVMKGVVTKAWLHDGKHVWKQEVQLRPDSGLFEISNSHFNLVDIGDMTWRKPAHLIKEVHFTDSELDQKPHYTDGMKMVVYKNSKVAGKLTNKTDVQ